MIFLGSPFGVPFSAPFGAARKSTAERVAALEARRLRLLEPSTQEFATEILAWCRENDIPVVLGETGRSRAAQERAIKAGRSGITSGKVGWHQLGRAFHLILYKPGTKRLDPAAYTRVGAEVRRRGGVWFGDTPLRIKGKLVRDLAHFEYHPGLTLWKYRETEAAEKAVALTEQRIARYGAA